MTEQGPFQVSQAQVEELNGKIKRHSLLMFLGGFTCGVGTLFATYAIIATVLR